MQSQAGSFVLHLETGQVEHEIDIGTATAPANNIRFELICFIPTPLFACAEYQWIWITLQ
jgi:hypothetical protein